MTVEDDWIVDASFERDYSLEPGSGMQTFNVQTFAL